MFYKEDILKLSNSEKEYKMIMEIKNDDDNALQISLSNSKNPMTENYHTKISLEELKELNSFFRIFDSILDCAQSLANIIKDSTPKLFITDKNARVVVSLFIPGSQKKEIEFNLGKKKEDMNNIISQLLEEINILKANIKDLNLLINVKDKTINEIKQKYEQLQKSHDSLEKKQKEDFINLRSYFTPYNEVSSIINNFIELNIISNKFRLIYPGKKVKYYVLYRKTRDIDSAFYFHSICDKIKGTLVLIQTEYNLRIGGYTSETWEGNNIYKKDNTAFIFSLNNNKIYNIKNNYFAIYCNPNLGPCFCGQNSPSLCIPNFCDLNNGQCCKKIDSNFDGYNFDYEINNDKKDFKIKEYEVIQVILE